MSHSAEPRRVIAGRYAVERMLGRGASAVVYLAQDLTYDRSVAVKVLRPELAESLGADRFLKEIRVTARLQHPNIVGLLDSGNDDGALFLVIPYLEGGTLRERLERERQMTIGESVSIAYALAKALDYAHQRGLVHRDVKPENVLFSGREPYLADFGIARVLDGELAGTTSTGVVRGTPAYMSPEQAAGERTYDGRSDIYSLGCVLYEMLAGVPAFAGATAQAVMAQRLVSEPEPLRRYRSTVPDALLNIVTRALALLPADRFQTAREFAEALGSSEAVSVSSSDMVRADERSARNEKASSQLESLGSWIRTKSHIVATVAAVTVIATGSAATIYLTRFSNADVGPSGVLSLRIDVGPEDSPSESQQLGLEVRDALRAELDAWDDVRVISSGNPRYALAAVRAIPIGDSVRIIVDVSSPGGPETRRVTRDVALEHARRPRTIATIAREVLAGPGGDSAEHATEMPGRSLTALRAYVAAWSELHAARLDSARSLFRRTFQLNPQFVTAALWAAQSGAWETPREPKSWKAEADGAVRGGLLTGADSALAAALVAMAAKDYPAACASFRSASDRDPSSFAAWFGLGECSRLDSVVVRGTGGARFRSSHWAALRYYAEAVERAPTSTLLAALFDPVMGTTYASGNRRRDGVTAGERPMKVSSLPGLDHDTLAFTPIPRADFLGLGPRAVPASHAGALRRGREVALDLTARWLRRFPQSSDAWFQRSLALELAGRIQDGPPETSALAALDRARTATSDELSRVRVAVARTRLALRRLDFASAGRAARTAVESPLPRDLKARAELAPLAMLIGSVARGDSLWVDDDAGKTVLPVALADSLRRFQIRAVSGDCTELEPRRQSLEQAVAVAFSPAELPAQREKLLLPAYRAAVPCVGPSIIAEFKPTRPMDSVYRALATHDIPTAKRLLSSLRQNRAGLNVAAISWDHLFAESWALVQVGEAGAAREQLAAALADLASMSGYTLSLSAQAAGLRRSLNLLVSAAAAGASAQQLQRWSAQLNALHAGLPSSKARDP